MTTKPKAERKDPEGRIYVDGPQDVPAFVSEAEERAFWLAHAWSAKSWKGARRGARPGTLRGRLVKRVERS
jgi:hypothetical protein